MLVNPSTGSVNRNTGLIDYMKMDSKLDSKLGGNNLKFKSGDQMNALRGAEHPIRPTQRVGS
jgi:hypothetical protein